VLRLALPKGRMQEGVLALLADAGVRVSVAARGYRPHVSLPEVEAKILKPQNIIEMLDAGSRDLGFAGADWVAELEADVVEVLDTGLDSVRIVAAAPRELVVNNALPGRALVVVSEYQRLTRRWCEQRGQGDRVVRSYGATEVFPPEDADCIVDVTQTGSTLEANGLAIVGELMRSSTRLYASRAAMADERKRGRIEDLAMLLRAVLEARSRVMLELNVSAEKFEGVCAALPCMREPTVSPLHAGAGYAVKSAVPRDQLPRLIPLLKSKGGTDIVISPIAQVVV
jgi:ATP phosphoribosyltransferase